MKSIKALCSPALLYLVLSVIALISMVTTLSLGSLAVKGFFIFLWTWFLDFLCRKGHTGISWFLVLLPFIFMLLIFFFAMDAMVMGTRGVDREGFLDCPFGSHKVLKRSDYWNNTPIDVCYDTDQTTIQPSSSTTSTSNKSLWGLGPMWR